MPIQKVRVTRDMVLFMAGLFGAAHEILLRSDVREGILILLGGMMGLPTFLHRDEKRQEETLRSVSAQSQPKEF